MNIVEFIAAEDLRKATLASRVDRAHDAYARNLQLITEERDAALANAQASDDKEQLANSQAYDAARFAEIEEAVKATNDSVGLLPNGKPIPTKGKSATAKKV